MQFLSVDLNSLFEKDIVCQRIQIFLVLEDDAEVSVHWFLLFVILMVLVYSVHAYIIFAFNTESII